MKVTVHRDAYAVLAADATGEVVSLTFIEAPPNDFKPRFNVELPGTTEDDPPLQGTRDDIIDALDGLVEKKKFGPAVIERFRAIAEAVITQPIPATTVDRFQLANEASRVRHARRTWLIEQIESGSFAAIEMLKNEFGETVKIHVEVTKEAA